ncbi:MAG: YqgE/AlgH family protein [Pararhodobacter sp.]
MTFDLTGKLLIATPAMGDPRFAHSVIYLCAHGPEGAFGLVTNRLIPGLHLRDILSQIDIAPGAAMAQSCAASPVRAGGPVEPARGFVLHRDGGPASVVDAPGQPLPGGLMLSASTEVLVAIAAGEGPREWFLALGYAGWGAGQLEAEIAQNAWLTADCPEGLLFGAEHGEAQWQAALHSIGVDPLSLSAVAGRA